MSYATHYTLHTTHYTPQLCHTHTNAGTHAYKERERECERERRREREREREREKETRQRRERDKRETREREKGRQERDERDKRERTGTFRRDFANGREREAVLYISLWGNSFSFSEKRKRSCCPIEKCREQLLFAKAEKDKQQLLFAVASLPLAKRSCFFSFSANGREKLFSTFLYGATASLPMAEKEKQQERETHMKWLRLRLFCRISSLLKGSFAKETYNLKAPTRQEKPQERETHMGWLRLVDSFNYKPLLQNIISIIGLFCRISSLLKGSFAKETYNFAKPTWS